MSNELQDLTTKKLNELRSISEPTAQMDKLLQIVSTQCARLDLLEERMDQANRMIAHNMFAIVRLEIANSCDAITNLMLDVKREKTGSGNAAIAIQVTATLAMIAGNVLTGGGMGVIGAVCVAAGTMAMAAAENDVGGMASGALSGVSASVVAGIDGTGVFSGWNLGQDSGPDEGTSGTQGIADMTGIAYESAMSLVGYVPTPKKEEPAVTSFKVSYKRTCFVAHGAGGTSAITYDVQTAIVNAYYSTIQRLGADIEYAKTNLVAAEGSLLKQISEAPMPSNSGGGEMKSDLHPLTKAVLVAALTELVGWSGEYSKIPVPSWPDTANTGAAKEFVKRGYTKLLEAAKTGNPFPTSEALIKDLRI